jgi:peptidyl-tRNA hydrolase
MSFEEVKISILRCDEEVLSSNLIEQLINYLPPPDQLKRLEDLQQFYEELSDAEQFAVTVRNPQTYMNQAGEQNLNQL